MVWKKPQHIYTSEGRCQDLLWRVRCSHNWLTILLSFSTQPQIQPPLFFVPFLSFPSFYFRLWQSDVLWHGWVRVTMPPSTETKHESKARRLRQTALLHPLPDRTKKISWYTYSILKKTKPRLYIKILWASFVLLLLCTSEVCVTWTQNKSSACLQQVKYQGVKFTYISASKRTSKCNSWASRESMCVHMCMYSKPVHQPECSLPLCIFWLVFFFFFLLQRQ